MSENSSISPCLEHLMDYNIGTGVGGLVRTSVVSMPVNTDYAKSTAILTVVGGEQIFSISCNKTVKENGEC